MIITVFSERNDKSFTAYVGIFLNSIIEEPVYSFSLNEPCEEGVEKILAKKIEELATNNYRWDIYFSKEIRTLCLENKNMYILDPDPYLNMNELQSMCFKKKA